MASLFFSYSHEDEELRDELEVHLAQLAREGLIQTMHDRRIPAGANLDDAIDAYLESADVVLCLLSPDFIASDYCYSREMGRALERHAEGTTRVIPVIVRHCDWKNTPLAALRGTPRDNKPVKAWSDRDEAWLDVANDVRAALASADGATEGAAGGVRGNEPIAGTSSAPTEPARIVERPRSANVAVERRFSDLDRDRYVREAFEFVSEYIANSLEEVKARASDVDGEFRRLDADRFVAVAYRDGRKAAAITVYVGGMSRAGREISFNLSDGGQTDASNGMFSVKDEAGQLGFSKLFDPYGRSRDGLLGKTEVAEQVWSAFFDPMSRAR